MTEEITVEKIEIYFRKMITQAAIFFFPGCFRWIHKQKIEPKISKFFFKNLTKTSCLNLEILSILIWFSSKDGV